MLTTIKIKCIEQTLQIINTPKIASGVKQVNTMQFEFCPTWNDFAKTAVFYRNEREVYHVLLVNDECVIPSEVLHDQGRFYFGVFGIKDNLRLTSEVLKYDVVKGSFILGQDPEEPTPSIYEQIINQYGTIEAKYNEIVEVYKNIYGDLEATVANMPAKGFANLNTGGEVVRFWVGTMAQYNDLESTEKDIPGVHYVLTDVETDSVPYYAIKNTTFKKDIEAVLLFCFQQLEVDKPFVVNLTRGYSGAHYSFLGCSYSTVDTKKRYVVLYEIDRLRTIKSNCEEESIELLTLDTITYTSETLVGSYELDKEVEKTTPLVVDSIEKSGTYSIGVGNQAGEYYNIVMYIDVDQDCYSSAVKFYYKGEYYDVWLYYSSGSLTLQYTSDELEEAIKGTTITRLLGV